MKLYTSREAAEKLGVNVNTLFRWINTGKIKARKAMLGSGWRFTDGDVKAMEAWRAAPLGVLDLVRLDDQTPERVAPQHAHLRPDLKLFGEYFPKYKSWAQGAEHPRRLLPHMVSDGAQFPWSILDSDEYLAALAEHRSKTKPAEQLSPEQEATNRFLAEYDKSCNNS